MKILIAIDNNTNDVSNSEYREFYSVFKELQSKEPDNFRFVKNKVKCEIQFNFVGYYYTEFDLVKLLIITFPKYYRFKNKDNNSNFYKIDIADFDIRDILDNKSDLMGDYLQLKSFKDDFELLSNVLAKYINEMDDDREFSEFEEDESENIIIPLYEVIKYYKHFGIYRDDQIVYEVGKKGKIDWNRTIKKITPIYDNNNFIYTDFILRKKSKISNIVTNAMKYVLMDGTYKLGWFIQEQDINFIDNNNALFTSNREYAIYLLYNELSVTYNDRSKRLIKCLISYLEIKSSTDIHDSKFKVNDFSGIWEKMVAYALPEGFKKTDVNVGKSFNGINVNEQTTKFEIDHFFESTIDNIPTYIIMDSKYKTSNKNDGYDFDNKQLLYHYAIEEYAIYNFYKNMIDNLTNLNVYQDLVYALKSFIETSNHETKVKLKVIMKEYNLSKNTINVNFFDDLIKYQIYNYLVYPFNETVENNKLIISKKVLYKKSGFIHDKHDSVHAIEDKKEISAMRIDIKTLMELYSDKNNIQVKRLELSKLNTDNT